MVGVVFTMPFGRSTLSPSYKIPVFTLVVKKAWFSRDPLRPRKYAFPPSARVMPLASATTIKLSAKEGVKRPAGSKSTCLVIGLSQNLCQNLSMVTCSNTASTCLCQLKGKGRLSRSRPSRGRSWCGLLPTWLGPWAGGWDC